MLSMILELELMMVLELNESRDAILIQGAGRAHREESRQRVAEQYGITAKAEAVKARERTARL